MVSPKWIVGGHPHDDLLDFARGGRAPGLPARRVIPLSGDQLAMSGWQCRGADGERLGPAAARDARGEGGEPKPVGRFVADLGDLAAQDGVLVAKDKKLGVLRDVAARDGGRGAEGFAGDPVGEGDQDPTMFSRPREGRSHYVSIIQIRITEPHALPSAHSSPRHAINREIRGWLWAAADVSRRPVP